MNLTLCRQNNSVCILICKQTGVTQGDILNVASVQVVCHCVIMNWGYVRQTGAPRTCISNHITGRTCDMIPNPCRGCLPLGHTMPQLPQGSCLLTELQPWGVASYATAVGIALWQSRKSGATCVWSVSSICHRVFNMWGQNSFSKSQFWYTRTVVRGSCKDFYNKL